jgi:hypothetical protein
LKHWDHALATSGDRNVNGRKRRNAWINTNADSAVFYDVVAQSAEYKSYFEGVSEKKSYGSPGYKIRVGFGKPKPRQRSIERRCINFLPGYNTAGMSLRTNVNRYIGSNIQRIINVLLPTGLN